MKLIVVTGGVRSGKSLFAEQLAASSSAPVLYVATGVVTDKEMAHRIERHRLRRPDEWGTLETPDSLGTVQVFSSYHTVLIDCLSTWITNRLVDTPEAQIRNAQVTQSILTDLREWLEAMKKYSGTVILVTSETGLGGIAMSRLGRWFQDVLGEANQLLAGQANEVYAVLSGIPLKIKGDHAV
ncbi:bifunctional adenosylcobinamide kinase/adenosylcobinamide-phosphate guanylyltransferase [Aneurinibacillus sp. Ricciae_BoGa-3]|uniref:bifunctional adenosylcobinamide kinase/adenosylcobinamide-phosphate guanylyltransferase n=1 Tax=Aneurinibacillus sp. Ricciae_BoGa-3 TaxID=3022697 RepID=UPI0023401901|nr:bifunctional adenosylcobinamide kinase/adenosylcobinamide-phosphate guanylyltransferase [Aneurinibacillus sp. Ricciae_BoGa-3]WCK53991.1 bifunctional adenosylcobinamide kinase/adenosylcobinamide-phosphate guanylyltransferase [Aneurinibacillus sp. Ricciae_BoGa-3]